MKIISKRGREHGNAQVPKVFTAKQLRALGTCAMDPVYFINNFCQLSTPGKGMTPFKLHDYQEDIIRVLHANRAVVACTARQVGTTSLVAAFLVWEAMFKSGATEVMLGSDTSALVATVHKLVSTVPVWLRPTITRLSRTGIEFDNGSRIRIGAATTSALVGVGASRIYIDSFAFLPPRVQHDIFLVLAPEIVKGTGCIIASTPTGPTGIFARVWNEAIAGRLCFKPVKITIDQLKHSAQWKAAMEAAIGQVAWKREFECEFV